MTSVIQREVKAVSEVLVQIDRRIAMTNQWFNIEDKAPKNGENVIVDWTDNNTDESYFSYAVWDTESGGWMINGTNCDNFTVNRWRERQ